MSRFKDLSGTTFGRLTVVKRSFPDGKSKKRTYWECKCTCGKTKVINGCSLVSKATVSCGCYNSERAALNGLTIKEPIPYGTVFNRIKCQARKRGLVFNINRDQFEKLVTGNCYLCGTPPATLWKKQAKKNPLARDLIYNGIDRIDNKIGYEIENCRTCCWTCNIMKRTQTIEDFILRISKILERSNNGDIK